MARARIRAVFPSRGGDSRCFSFTRWRFALFFLLGVAIRAFILATIPAEKWNSGKKRERPSLLFKKKNIFLIFYGKVTKIDIVDISPVCKFFTLYGGNFSLLEMDFF